MTIEKKSDSEFSNLFKSDYKHEYPIDLFFVRQIRKLSDGSVAFLCAEDTEDGERYYLIKASPKNKNYEETIRNFEKL